MWVFCYGSLMWDKWEVAFGGANRQLAKLTDYRRAFDKKSTARWGTPDHPGATVLLMRDDGAECTGVAFEFPDERETEILKYLAKREGDKFDLSDQDVTLADGSTALASVPMYSGKNRVRATSLSGLAKMVLAAKGTAGACYDYVKNLNELLAAEGIDDAAVKEAWAAVEAEKPLIANVAGGAAAAGSRYEVGFTTSPSFIDLLGQRVVVEYGTPEGKAEYAIRQDAPNHCHWIGPIAAHSGREACDIARHFLNLYMDRLSVQSRYGLVLNYDHPFQNLDVGSDRGRIVGVQVSGLSEGAPFLVSVAVSDTAVSSSYYRKGVTATEPFEQYRNFYLAIEEVGKRIRKSIDPDAKAESSVVEDTVEKVFDKTDGPDLQTFRSKLPEAELSLHFQDGKGHAKHCLNEFFFHIYRCALMHSGKTAKPGSEDEKETFAPFRPADVERVRNVLPLVAELALRYVVYDIANPS